VSFIQISKIGAKFEFLKNRKGQDGNTLHIEDVHVSNIIRQGDNTTLDCDYNLNGTVLYVLRWYKDDQEFYRYMPREMPANKDFNVSGVRVLVSSWNLND
jgi:hypothetical protein